MTRTALIRPEVQRLLGLRPFRPFVLTLENGERAVIEHPENIAFDPDTPGPAEFYVISGRLRLFSTFESVSAVALLDAGGEARAE